MKLSRFRRKNFTPLKKRRRQIKRRPTKKFNIRKTHNMRGGALMAMLNKENIARIKAMEDWFPSIKDQIDAIKPGTGIEFREDSNTFVLRPEPGSGIYITEELYPNIYHQVSEIYSTEAKSGLQPVPIHKIPDIKESGTLHDGERSSWVTNRSVERPTLSLGKRLMSALKL